MQRLINWIYTKWWKPWIQQSTCSVFGRYNWFVIVVVLFCNKQYDAKPRWSWSPCDAVKNWWSWCCCIWLQLKSEKHSFALSLRTRVLETRNLVNFTKQNWTRKIVVHGNKVCRPLLNIQNQCRQLVAITTASHHHMQQWQKNNINFVQSLLWKRISSNTNNYKNSSDQQLKQCVTHHHKQSRNNAEVCTNIHYQYTQYSFRIKKKKTSKMISTFVWYLLLPSELVWSGGATWEV